MPRGQQLNGSAAETEAAFYDALARADLDALMALWADDEEIVCIHPGAPRLLGHAAIRASWEAIFENGSVHISPILLHQTHNLMSAIHNVVEEVTQAAGAQQDMHILATNVFIKTPHGWRIVAHHASVAPGKPQHEPPKATLLH
jgi:ketosteroid isomerase-like protein